MEPILGPILGPDRPKRGQYEPKRTIKSFKEPKNCIFKKVVFELDCRHFSLLGPPKRASRGPRRLPKDTQRTPRPQKKGTQNWTQKLSTFGQILEQFWGPKRQAKKNKKKHIFGTPFPRISGVQIMPRQKKRERGKKPTGTGIILSKRKGGIWR